MQPVGRKPKLNVLLITYNHEKLIRRCLQGVINQKVNFPIEVIVGEDCSTDGTRRILLEVKEEFPDLFNILPRPNNLGAFANFVDVFRHANGEYIALLEGDDWWSCPTKLQQQVDFLDANKSYSGITHNAFRFEEASGRVIGLYSNGVPSDLYLRDLARCLPVATCAAVFRNVLSRELPEWFLSVKMGDWPLHLLHAQHGPIKYIDEPLAHYCIHSEGMWGGATRIAQIERLLELHSRINAVLDYEFDAEVRRTMSNHLLELGCLKADAGARLVAIRLILKSFLICPINRDRSAKATLKAVLKVCGVLPNRSH